MKYKKNVKKSNKKSRQAKFKQKQKQNINININSNNKKYGKPKSQTQQSGIPQYAPKTVPIVMQNPSTIGSEATLLSVLNKLAGGEQNKRVQDNTGAPGVTRRERFANDSAMEQRLQGLIPSNNRIHPNKGTIDNESTIQGSSLLEYIDNMSDISEENPSFTRSVGSIKEEDNNRAITDYFKPAKNIMQNPQEQEPEQLQQYVAQNEGYQQQQQQMVHASSDKPEQLDGTIDMLSHIGNKKTQAKVQDIQIYNNIAKQANQSLGRNYKLYEAGSRPRYNTLLNTLKDIKKSYE